MGDLRQRLRQQNLTAWDYWGPEIIKAVERLQMVDLASADGLTLAGHLEEALAVRSRHFFLHPIMWFKPETAYFEAFAALSGLAGLQAEAAAYRLLEGEENVLTKVIDDLFALAETARRSPAVSTLIADPAPDVSGRLLQLTGKDRLLAETFLAQLKSFLASYGERNGNGYGSVATICTPTWAEDPGPVLRLVAAYVDPAVEAPRQTRARARQEREAQIEALCQASESEAAVVEFRRELAYARKAYTVLEEHNHYIDQAGPGHLRAAILAAGSYLATRGTLDSQGEVFWLRWDEVLTVLRSGESEPLAARIGSRKAQHASWQTLEPPPFLGLPQARLPERPAFQDEVVQQPPQKGDRLKGLGASPGRYQGRARVVHDRLSMPEISRGDILVAYNAGPLWTPLFPLLGGLILDGGSLGQHAAVTAREYGLPAVIDTRVATRQIPDGAWLTLDGAAGTVEIGAD